MRYLDYQEKRKHGSFEFPFAFYHVNANHPRYYMLHHWHPEFELIRITRGAVIMQLDGKEISAKAGDSFFITGGMVHSCIPQNCQYECIVFDMDFFLKEQRNSYKDLLSIIYHDRILPSFYPSEMKEENGLFKRISHAFTTKLPGYELVMQGCFYQFLGIAVEKNLFQKSEELPENLRKIKQFKSVISMIQQRYSENITLFDMADTIHMNPNYFCRFFDEMAHQTPVKYLNFYRVESACEKLLASDKSITEIAMECGFNDSSYFVKVFKKFKGVTPTEYSKRHLP